MTLQAVVGPLMSQMQETYNMAVYQASRENIMRLNRLIVSVGSIGKGFPDFDGSSSTSIPPWSPVFSQAFQVMVKILEQFNSEDVIREAVRFSLQRLVGCMGSDIMSGILPVLKSGLICSHSSKELVEFLNFAGMLTFKFKVSCF